VKQRLSLQQIGQKAQNAFGRLNRRLGGIPLLLKRTLDSYNAHDGMFVAAAMTYFLFLSLFPLILILIIAASQVLNSEQIRQAVVNAVSQALPGSGDVVTRAIDQALAQRGAVGILAGLSLLYSASGLFGLLLAVVNRPWAALGARPSLLNRVLAVALVLAFIAVFFLILIGTTAAASAGGMIARSIGLTPSEWSTAFNILSIIISFVVTVGLFLVLYWKLPAARVQFADAWPAAVAAGVAWVAARSFIAWYLSTFTHYSVVYGSFAAIIGLLVWLNLTGFIILLGAELSAQIAIRRGRGPAPPS